MPEKSYKFLDIGLTPRITLASLVAYFWGEYANSVILAKLKIITAGKFLWIRTIIIFTPVTYWVVNRLKVGENEDYYDKDTRFTPV